MLIERLDHYLHKNLDRLLLQNDMHSGHDHNVPLADVKIGWNFVQHTYNILTGFHKFEIMPRILGSLSEDCMLNKRIALMHFLRPETKKSSAHGLLFLEHRILIIFTLFFSIFC